jgi:hypothetical protein
MDLVVSFINTFDANIEELPNIDEMMVRAYL